MNRYDKSRRETCGLAFYDTCTLQMDFMREKTIRVPEKLRRETARGGSPMCVVSLSTAEEYVCTAKVIAAAIAIILCTFIMHLHLRLSYIYYEAGI